MSRASLATLARWSCVPLLLLVLLLLTALHVQRRDTQALLATAESPRAEYDKLLGQIDASQAASAAKTTAPDPERKKAPPQGLRHFSDSNAMSDPVFGPPVVRRHRRYALANYRTAIAALHLPPAEEARLRELIVQRWNAGEDVHDIMARSGGASEAVGAKVSQALQAEADREITQLLGEERADLLETLYLQSSRKGMSWGLTTAFWDAGHPLSAEQQASFTHAQLMVEAQFEKTGKSTERDPATGMSPKDLALIEATAPFLSPVQLELLRQDAQISARLKLLWAITAPKSSAGKPSP